MLHLLLVPHAGCPAGSAGGFNLQGTGQAALCAKPIGEIGDLEYAGVTHRSIKVGLLRKDTAREISGTWV